MHTDPPADPAAPHFRPLTPGDAAVVHELHGDPATNRHNPFGASPDRAASAALLDGWLEHRRAYGFGYDLAVVDGQVAGICGARHDVWRSLPVLNLYWRLLPEFQGRGLAPALGRHALRMAAAAGGGTPVVARMLAGNTGSRRVAEQLGLHRRPDLDGPGHGADWILYADLPTAAERLAVALGTAGPR
ncbi:GNAT family N-acetyltransferase [Nakamurella sp. YIM 132087]|uniref:GNAT family N-acetyltransferase n=1 Tax=Nakamurella alba TaxID=2665158 RepID=A0A7K1FJY3_9ACTN|nr:GNAT family N-acetyltransferase [Nakamurella alba]MTD13739.1 GNAT family N-acetyltransferase [Nakamurella alba]